MILKDLINNFVTSSKYQHILQSFEWGLAKQTGSPEWKTYYQVVTKDGSEFEYETKDENMEVDIKVEDIISTSVILVRDLFLGQKIMYIPRGPVVDWENAQHVSLALQKLNGFFTKKKIAFVKIEPNNYNKESFPFDSFSKFGFAKTNSFVQVRDSVFVDIAPTEEEILQHFHKKHRYNIKLCEKKGLKAYVSDKIEDLDKFWALYMGTNDRRDNALNPHGRFYYENILKVLMPSGFAKFVFVEMEGKIISSSIMFSYGKEAIYMYGGFDYEYRKYMPNHLREWESMRWAKQNGKTQFDLWGLTLRSDPGGIKRYKLGFNENIVEYVGVFERYRNIMYSILIKFVTMIRGR